MGHNLASWRLLEDMMLELKKSGATIPIKVVEDLRAAKSMIHLSYTEGSHGDALQKVEEYLANVEAYVVTEGQKTFGSMKVNDWLKHLQKANAKACEQLIAGDKFVTGVPRDQKWIRIEPTEDFSVESIERMVKDQSLQIKKQVDGKLVIYGQPDDLKALLQKMVAKSSRH
jgi:hypothetical protein